MSSKKTGKLLTIGMDIFICIFLESIYSVEYERGSPFEFSDEQLDK